MLYRYSWDTSIYYPFYYTDFFVFLFTPYPLQRHKVVFKFGRLRGNVIAFFLWIDLTLGLFIS